MGAVGDKHYLMAATVGEDDKVARLRGALQGDGLLGCGQAIDIFFKGESVRVHMALHGWLISGTVFKASR